MIRGKGPDRGARLPGDADISQAKISILTPIGAALIGLSVEDSITWETRTGEIRQLTVLKISESHSLRLAAAAVAAAVHLGT
jgi:hypothetical protein